MNTRACWPLACVLLATACGNSATQVIVTIDAEPGVRTDSMQLHVVVLGGAGDSISPTGSPFDRTLTPGAGSPADPPYPFTIAIAPIAGDVTRSYSVTATAQTAGGAFVARARVIGGYLEGETLRVRLVLEDPCRGVMCGEGQTCSAGECVDARTGNAIDGGVLDAGHVEDAGLDAEADDAGDQAPDAGGDSGVSPVDGGTTDLGTTDLGTPDLGTTDLGTSDSGASDAGCVTGTTRLCTTTCLSTGVATCAIGVFGACVPPAETCNGVDDDCDGTTDEGCGAMGLRVEVTWDGTGNVDLHLHNSTSTSWFATNDCYHGNTATTWGANLDFDNVTSSGPENVRMDAPALATNYTIGVHNHSGASGRIATVKVFCGSTTSTTPTMTFISRPLAGGATGDCTTNDFWKVARVRFTTPTACTITSVNTYGGSSAACTAF